MSERFLAEHFARWQCGRLFLGAHDVHYVIAIVVFAGDLRDSDVDRAALELERSGYQVTRLPDKLGARLAHPLDDFLEATIALAGPADDKVIDEIQKQVDAIVDPYGGLVDEWGLLEPDHVPFGFFSPDPISSDQEVDAPWIAGRRNRGR